MAVDDKTDEVIAGFEVPGAQDTSTFVNVLKKLKQKAEEAPGGQPQKSKL